MRTSDYIAEYLENIGVEKVFLLSGGGMMHLLDAFSRRKNLTYVCNHHEQASGMAADGYARVSGKLGVCCATSGPGGTNTITAVVGAHQDSSPVLFISGQSKVSQTINGTNMHGLRQFGTFEVDIIPLVKSATKYAAVVTKAEDVRYHLEKAIYYATEGRPGAVFLDIPVDIQGAPVNPKTLRAFDPSEIAEPKKLNSDISESVFAVIQKLKNAKHPLILAGHGVRSSKQFEKFYRVIEALNIPVVTTCFANDLLHFSHPLFTGHPGMKGDRAGNFAVQTADVILTLGCSLHVTTTGYELDQFAPEAYKIMVEIDPWVLQREQVNVNEKINCSVEDFLFLLETMLPADSKLCTDSNWHLRCTYWKNNLSVYKEPHQHLPGKINYYDFMEKLDLNSSSSDIIVTDAGSSFYIVGQAFRVKKGQRIISSGSLGAMGFAIPAATGAACAEPDKSILCITGDGSLQTNIHELAVIRKNNLNVKIFIINNDGYVSIRNTQNNFFSGHLAGTSNDSGVFIPNTEKLANAYEIPYISTDKIENLEETIKRALNATGPMLCEIFTPSHQEILPTVSSIRLENGSMKSKPLHDMFPFMDAEKRKSYLEF